MPMTATLSSIPMELVTVPAGGLLGIDLYVAAAGLAVGFTVGLTGMGGGALMTPILVVVFGVQPLAAVSSDLVASFVMKPVGGGCICAAAPSTSRWSSG
jgi:uncharacterized membrane protein YfcA